MKIKNIIPLLCALYCTQCAYKDYSFKEKLVNEFYLMESDVLPSKYISLDDSDTSLIIIYDVIEIVGNVDTILVKTQNNRTEEYALIEIDKVKYPEDVEKISYNEFLRYRKILNQEYSYDTAHGFIRKK